MIRKTRTPYRYMGGSPFTYTDEVDTNRLWSLALRIGWLRSSVSHAACLASQLSRLPSSEMLSECSATLRRYF